jgi:hypothetical protein
VIRKVFAHPVWYFVFGTYFVVSAYRYDDVTLAIIAGIWLTLCVDHLWKSYWEKKHANDV